MTFGLSDHRQENESIGAMKRLCGYNSRDVWVFIKCMQAFVRWQQHHNPFYWCLHLVDLANICCWRGNSLPTDQVSMSLSEQWHHHHHHHRWSLIQSKFAWHLCPSKSNPNRMQYREVISDNHRYYWRQCSICNQCKLQSNQHNH